MSVSMAFFIGMVVGGIIGLFAIAILSVSSETDNYQKKGVQNKWQEDL